MTTYACADCDRPVKLKDPERLQKGSTVRDPGEPLCRSCTASRLKLVQDLAKLPDTLDQIRAIKASGGFYSKQGDIPRW